VHSIQMVVDPPSMAQASQLEMMEEQLEQVPCALGN
jgi:hypothetical protein